MNGELEYRTAQMTGVSWPNRTIDLVVMPYESETVVPVGGRMVREIVSRGAFDGIERRARRVHVNRDHDITRLVGKAVTFHPSREEGLVAEIKISTGPLCDETLAFADDGLLDASAGFTIRPEDVLWEEHRQLRRLTRVFLAHIAMTPDPAYEAAKVLAVRATPETPSERPPRPDTPNLDQIRRWRLEARLAALDGR